MPGQLTFVNSWRRDVIKGVHHDTDTYKMAIFTSAAALDEDTAAYAPANEVVGTGYVAGGVALTGFNVAIRGATPKVVTLDFDNPTLDPVSIVGRKVLIYNDTLPGKDAVAVGDLGADISSTNGPWTPGFPAPGATTSMLQW